MHRMRERVGCRDFSFKCENVQLGEHISHYVLTHASQLGVIDHAAAAAVMA